jgi:hypothetical protein
MGYYGNLEKKKLIQQLRQDGHSYREIEKLTQTSKSTIGNYCQNIKLNKQQIQKLIKNKNEGLIKASLSGAKSNKDKRISQEKQLLQQGIDQVGKLSKRDKFIAGIALYQGEGSKTNNAVEFTNSNPETINFMVNWLHDFCQIDLSELKFSLWLHDNLDETKAIGYWCDLLKIKSSQFGKTYFAKNKENSPKIRKNIHQFGIMKIRFYNSAKLRLILGWIKGVLSS